MKRREFIKRGALFVPTIFIPRLIRAQSILTAEGLAAFVPPAASGGGGGGGTDPNPMLVTSQDVGGTHRTDVDGEVGFQFSVGGSPITVTSLGRWVLSGNSKTHLLVLRSGACGSVIVSCTVNCSGATPGDWVWGSITPTVLSASTSYRVMSTESISGGDEWLNLGPITVTSAANSISGCYFISGTCGNGAANESYVPVNLKYQ